MKPRERRFKKNRQAILDVALTLVIEKGADKLSLRDIARHVDYSPSGLYEYFNNKEEIISILCARGFDRLALYLKEAPLNSLVSHDLLELGLAYLRFAQENSEYYRLIFNFIPSKRSSLEEPVVKEGPYAILVNAMAEGIAKKEFSMAEDDSADTLSYSFWSILHGQVMLRLTVLKDFNADFDKIHRRAIEIFIRGLMAE